MIRCSCQPVSWCWMSEGWVEDDDVVSAYGGAVAAEEVAGCEAVSDVEVELG